MDKRLTVAELLALDLSNPADVATMERHYRDEEKRAVNASQSSRVIYRDDVSGNAAPLTETVDDGAPTVGKANEVIETIRAWCASHDVKADVAEFVSALSRCKRYTVGAPIKVGSKKLRKYPFSMSELGDVLGCSKQCATQRYVNYVERYETAVKTIMAECGLVA